MGFTEAARQFLESRAILADNGRNLRIVAPRTYEDYEQEIHMATQFFGELRLDQIEPHHFRSYQQMRASGEGFVRRMGGKRKGFELKATTCGAAKINDELELVKRVMVEAGAWTAQHVARYRKLQEPASDIPRALSRIEQEHFLGTAARNPEWNRIYWYSLVARATTFSSDEMRTIRQGDINFAFQILRVNNNHGKNNYRRREIPIADPDCMWALERLVEYSRSQVGDHPSYYLFPKSTVRGRYNGLEPTGRHGCLRPLFEEVRDYAGLGWFRLNGWRHTAITNLAEEGVPIAVIMSLAGHISPKMTAHYTHISEQAQRLHLGRAYANRQLPRPELPEKKPPVSIIAQRLQQQRGYA